jgi:glycosyltransferase involved in cell wall biosynthesis
VRIAVFYNIPFGGAKRVVLENVKGLRALSHKVDVYTLSHEQDIFEPGVFADNEYVYAYQPKEFNIPVLSRIVKDFQSFYSLKKLHKKIAEDINSKDYDIALIYIDTNTHSPYILRFLRVKNVYFCFEPLRMVYEYALRIPSSLNWLNKIYEHINRTIRKRIDRRNARFAMHITTLSLFAREYIIQAYDLYPTVSYIGVDEKVFKKNKQKKKNQILFVAEKEYIYGYDLLKDALGYILKKNRPKLKIVFGTKKSQRITDKELISIYNESLVTLSLSRFDTFGLVPLESMACETPVIALNVAGYREIIRDGETGFLVGFDPKEISEKIDFFIQNPQASSEMGKNGRESIEGKWTWKKQILDLENLLIKLSQQVK